MIKNLKCRSQAVQILNIDILGIIHFFLLRKKPKPKIQILPNKIILPLLEIGI